MKNIQSILSILNENQRKAVEITEGPLMIIAGPGTGKTQVVASRIANLLASDQSVGAETILCLTYTEAGAKALKQRLISLIGAEAHKINTTTFHGFCSQIILHNHERFGRRELTLLEDIDKVEILERIFDSASFADSYFGNYNELTKYTSGIFKIMKEEELTYEKLKQAAQKEIDNMPFNDEYIYKAKSGNNKAGDLKMGLVNTRKKQLKKILNVAAHFEQFEHVLKEKGYFEYIDQIKWVVNEFKRDKDFKMSFQEKYQYITVDEFQDTNGLQNELLTLLTDYWEAPNLCVVGDDDQSIYRFQGANLYNVLHFYERFKEIVQIVVLDVNYRSTKKIIDASNHIIEKNTQRLVGSIPNLVKKLKPANEGNVGQKVSVKCFDNLLQEQAWICDQIEKAYKNGEDLSDIAIIYKEHSQATNIIHCLEIRNIPLNVKETVNILSDTLFVQIITLIKLIINENCKSEEYNYYLNFLIRFDFVKLSQSEISQIISTKFTDENNALYEVFKNPSKFLTDANLCEKISSIDSNIEFMKGVRFNASIPVFIQNLYEKFGILEFAVSSGKKNYLIKVLTTLLKNATAFQNSFQDGDVSDYLRKIEKMQSHGLKLSLDNSNCREGGVEFVTAHSSKGKEFKRVYIISCVTNTWNKKSKNSDHFPEDILNKTDEFEQDEQRRLFFVALTRGKSEVHISYSTFDGKDKAITESQFVTELIESDTNVEVSKVSVPSEITQKFEIESLTVKPQTTSELISKELVDEKLKSFSLTATKLNKYLRCPVAFYFEEIQEVKAPESEQLVFGNVIHNTLEAFCKLYRKTGEMQTVDLLLEKFVHQMERRKSSFSESNYSKRLETGKNALLYLYENKLKHLPQTIESEKYFNMIEVDGVPIEGRADLVISLGGDVNLVDFKVSAKFNDKKVSAPTDKNRYGGDYWRQLAFYSILATSKPYCMSVNNATIECIQTNADDYLATKSITITSDLIEIIKSIIKETYENIKQYKFYEGCNEEDCIWCKVANAYNVDKIKEARLV